MKKLVSIFAVLLLLLSTSVFAENHADLALEHANKAAEAGQSSVLVEHAKVALEHSLAAAIVAKGVPKTHLDAASGELQEAIDHGNLGHTDIAAKHVEAAIEHIKASSKK